MQQRKLKIYFTSDVHGYFYPTTYGDMTEKNVGLFGCAGNFKKDEDTLILDGGDILQGSAFAYYCRQVATVVMITIHSAIMTLITGLNIRQHTAAGTTVYASVRILRMKRETHCSRGNSIR